MEVLFAEARGGGGGILELQREPSWRGGCSRAEVRTPGLCSRGQGWGGVCVWWCRRGRAALGSAWLSYGPREGLSHEWGNPLPAPGPVAVMHWVTVTPPSGCVSPLSAAQGWPDLSWAWSPCLRAQRLCPLQIASPLTREGSHQGHLPPLHAACPLPPAVTHRRLSLYLPVSSMCFCTSLILILGLVVGFKTFFIAI